MGTVSSVVAVFVLLYDLMVWFLGLLVSTLTSGVAAVAAALLSSLWAVGLAVALFAGSALLELGGVDDVHGTLDRRLFGADARRRERAADVPDVAPETVTDGAGRFSSSAFHTATGMTPPEFIHLFVRCHGGQVNQTTINRCLPWSKATASRYLDELESEGMVTRVNVGGRNVVCTPENAPDGPSGH